MPTLPELRISRTISQRDLAKKTGVATSTISRLENGIQKPNFRTINKLADGLGVEPSEVEFIGLGRITMQYNDAIICTRNRRYLVAANLIVKEHLTTDIHRLGQYRRDRLTQIIARKLKANHLNLRKVRDSSFTPIEIAEEAYENTYDELVTEGVFEPQKITNPTDMSK